MTHTLVCFGELLLRLGAPDRELLLQSPRFDVHVGGAEANVAISLARLGHSVRMATVLPDNPLGDHALGELRRHGVDTRAVQRGDGRMGLYFLATGAGVRPSEVLYDRTGSAFARAAPDAIDWQHALDGADWLHLSGVTPALGSNGAKAAQRAADAARARGMQVVFDGNYRSRLWQAWDGDAPTILRGLLGCADLAFADHRDIAVVLGHEAHGNTPRERFVSAAAAAFAALPQLQRIASTVREQHSVDHHTLSALLCTRDGDLVTAPACTLTSIVDRIGGGDAFAAGVIHGLRRNMTDADSLHFGLAAACLKHSIPGDFNRVAEADVAAFVADGRLDVRR
ncbi:sugar kinase [Chiayiivirga flava]|uniref:2-dehydro-3-deoxygluconokinase n=1 Tax=Chiayiivirga flava TaxID=659595 RepID=A0A7W8G1J9_9GAMM|nr:sugar kinase [Chiayiivirga flava]MBB5208943.1 2-dehydro-3-deoxygluconokinase [Chiayiivirga flava]